MPANNQIINQKIGRTPAGSNTPTNSVRLSPATPNRTFLLIQNTGANPGLLRLGNKVQADGGDLTVPAGGAFGPFDIAETCPTESIDIGSALATTWAIIEGTSR